MTIAVNFGSFSENNILYMVVTIYLEYATLALLVHTKCKGRIFNVGSSTFLALEE